MFVLACVFLDFRFQVPGLHVSFRCDTKLLNFRYQTLDFHIHEFPVAVRPVFRLSNFRFHILESHVSLEPVNIGLHISDYWVSYFRFVV